MVATANVIFRIFIIFCRTIICGVSFLNKTLQQWSEAAQYKDFFRILDEQHL